MKRLGYYALEKSSTNLIQFEWGPNDEFYVFKDGKKEETDPKLYEILEIGYFTADSDTSNVVQDREVLSVAKQAIEYMKEGDTNKPHFIKHAEEVIKNVKTGGSIEECEQLEDLIDAVIDQMKKDINTGDTTAIAEVLRYIPKENLEAYLPEGERGATLVPCPYETIHYAGKDYPVRTFDVIIGGAERTIKVSVESLDDAMGWEKDEHGTEEYGIDEEIYFYMKDEYIHNPAEYICKHLLDEPLDFIKEH